MFVTPPESRQEEVRGDIKRKRSPGVVKSLRAQALAQEASASPDLKKVKNTQMKRTPQANMAQSWLSTTA